MKTIIVLIVGLIGLFTIEYGTNFETAIGVFIMAFAHNIEKH